MKRLLLVFITIFVSPFGVVSDGTTYFKEAGVQDPCGGSEVHIEKGWRRGVLL